MSKVLTPEAEDEHMDFIRDYGYDGNCSCHLSPPCNSCIHPGNPLNQAEDESCWMDEPEALLTNTRILVSRNKREGWYHGKDWTGRHNRSAEFRIGEFDGSFIAITHPDMLEDLKRLPAKR